MNDIQPTPTEIESLQNQALSLLHTIKETRNMWIEINFRKEVKSESSLSGEDTPKGEEMDRIENLPCELNEIINELEDDQTEESFGAIRCRFEEVKSVFEDC